MYEEWVENCCDARSDCVLVALKQESVAGFIALNIDEEAKQSLGVRIGGIDLLAVSPSVRGAGIGLKLVKAGVNWLRQRVDRIEVRTQLYNSNALRIYQASGFTIGEPSLSLRPAITFHKWMQDGALA